MGLIEKQLLRYWEGWRWEGVYSRMEANDQALEVLLFLPRDVHLQLSACAMCIAGENQT